MMMMMMMMGTLFWINFVFGIRTLILIILF
ncbi:hypothetical protein QR98_0095380 [Sarcoptes scabiei]|uniref:Uncharacterized protein n=1 Tax=Sarcoptes scabiei TaxID=52283 RepID=A0A132AJ65_SARSC|nr:hypothetical protein QR98_0095380 [Sarcoptes scabiei]